MHKPNLHTKSLSSATAATTSSGLPRNQSYANSHAHLLDDNMLLKNQTKILRQQLAQAKRTIMDLYQENIILKQTVQRSTQNIFIQECQSQIERLRAMVAQLMEVKSIGPSERQEIKDRIIMKLEDELITVKIQLKQSKNRIQ